MRRPVRLPGGTNNGARHLSKPASPENRSLQPFGREPGGGPGTTPAAAHRFRRRLYRFFHDQGRQLPWRATTDPYHIFVSEIMLQQTQVERVALKYEPFINAFPDVWSLARGPLRDIMAAWQGLGYNRRALGLAAHRPAIGGGFRRQPPRLG